jgi:DNA-binding CsgD family transcriptional regulator
MTLYFDDGPSRGDHLPEELQRWVRAQPARFDGDNTLTGPPKPLVVIRQDTRLNIRLIPDSPDALLVLEEEHTNVNQTTLRELGLTQRETEVLHWVREGKTNKDIGTILRASPRTVGKHLERVYAKLGVETRTAAAARAHV